MPTYKQALKVNEQYAKDNGKEPTAVKLLLLHYAGMSNTALIDNLDKKMPKDNYRSFRAAVDEYVIDNRPIQHITEQEYFYGYPFNVDEKVMIPRCETEELVSYTLELIDEHFADKKTIDLLDIGTGSGCLAIALSKEESKIRAVGTELSEEALSMARKNNNDLDGTVEFVQGDLLTPVEDMKFDVFVSNPPYIPNDEDLEPVVKDYEPHMALFGGEDGLDYYRRILKEIKPHLRDEFLIAFEHAFNQAKAIKKLVKKELGNVSIIQKKDLQGKDRMTFVKNKRK